MRTHLLSPILFTLLFLIAQQTGYGQSLSVAGKVVSSDENEPLPGVSVQLSGASGQITDANGACYFGNLSKGEYTLS